MSRNSGSKDSGERVRNKEFARVTYFFVILFIALMGYLVYFMVVRAKLVVNSPYNQRQDAYADTIIRGSIVDKNGNVLAQTLGMMDQRRESILMEKCLLMRSDTVIPSLELRVWNR